jgi:hypothetical protein
MSAAKPSSAALEEILPASRKAVNGVDGSM